MRSWSASVSIDSRTDEPAGRRLDDRMSGFKKIEYEQLSQDWRHRDILTWQLPSVLVIGTGILVGEAFLDSARQPFGVPESPDRGGDECSVLHSSVGEREAYLA